MAALVACLLVLLVEPRWTMKILPMLRDRPSVVDPLPAEVSAPVVLCSPAAVLVDSPEGAAGCGACQLGAGRGHVRLHSARVMKLLLLPWHPPYQKCTHLEEMTSKWYRDTQLLQEPAARGREQIDRSTAQRQHNADQLFVIVKYFLKQGCLA